MAHKLFRAQSLLLIALAALYALGLWLQLFWVFWWYDIMMHFLGGVWIALALRSTFVAYGREPSVVLLFAAVITVGVAWEVFEVAIGAYREMNYWFDTTIDIVMDTLGCVLVIFLRGSEKSAEKSMVE